ncbi:hypothetical protein P4M26_13050 [Pseudomonas aeruginosa]|nr:hypothetical protein [Pseudomonas aeruginosa]MDF5994294.1 hypothetical protein [Pseudomonas aeruginosa]
MSRVFVSPLATPFHSLVPIFPIPSRYISIFRAPPLGISHPLSRWRNSSQRRDWGSNTRFDENRLIVSYPLSLL